METVITNPSVNLICATGRSGQIGLNGALPWGDSEDPVIKQRASADLRFFKRATQGCTIVVGYKTYESLLEKYPLTYWNRTNRSLVLFSRDFYNIPMTFLEILKSQGKDIWIAGGASTYRRLLPYVDGVISINVINEYDGAADTWFPFFDLNEYLVKIQEQTDVIKEE